MRYRPVENGREHGGFRSDDDRLYDDGYDDFEGGFVPDRTPFDPEELSFSEQDAAENHDRKLRESAARSQKQRRRSRRRTILFAALSVFLLFELFFLYKHWARPPAVNDRISGQTSTLSPFDHVSGRRDGCYTFLIAGKDKAASLTDTVLVGMMDTEAHTLRFVSIPRDTAVNISWSPKKINQYYPAAENQGRSGTEALLEGVEKIIGYRVDCYAIFDVDVFVDLVDTMGGVEFDVPINMDYEDPAQNLYIHVKQGYQKLNGYDTMCVFRFRSAYPNGDIGRLNVQHDLLKSIASQMLSLGNIPNVRKLVDLFERNVITNLSTGNVMFFVQEFLKMQDDAIVFETIPADYGGTVHGMSYVVIYLDAWLTYLNEHLNPYTTEITVDNVDIIYRTSGGALTATTGEIRGNDRW